MILESFNVICRNCQGEKFSVRVSKVTETESSTLSVTLRCVKCGIEVKLREHTVTPEAGTKLLTEKT